MLIIPTGDDIKAPLKENDLNIKRRYPWEKLTKTKHFLQNVFYSELATKLRHEMKRVIIILLYNHVGKLCLPKS